MKVGYARVSTRDQNLDLQLEALQKSGCEEIFSEKVSAVVERPELEKKASDTTPTP
jgi:DNA invertase Pin-like site-specific DNA recombinase